MVSRNQLKPIGWPNSVAEAFEYLSDPANYGPDSIFSINHPLAGNKIYDQSQELARGGIDALFGPEVDTLQEGFEQHYGDVYEAYRRATVEGMYAGYRLAASGLINIEMAA